MTSDEEVFVDAVRERDAFHRLTSMETMAPPAPSGTAVGLRTDPRVRFALADFGMPVRVPFEVGTEGELDVGPLDSLVGSAFAGSPFWLHDAYFFSVPESSPPENLFCVVARDDGSLLEIYEEHVDNETVDWLDEI